MNFKTNNHWINFDIDDKVTIIRNGNRIARVVIIEVLESSKHREIMKKVMNVINLDDDIYDLLSEHTRE